LAFTLLAGSMTAESTPTSQRVMSVFVLFLVDVISRWSVQSVCFIIAALWNRAGHYIFVLWFLSSIYLLFFPRLISAFGDWMSTILRHMMWP